MLSGGNGNDKLYGGEGDDVLQGGPGADFFDCGDGIDIVIDSNVTEDIGILSSQANPRR